MCYTKKTEMEVPLPFHKKQGFPEIGDEAPDDSESKVRDECPNDNNGAECLERECVHPALALPASQEARNPFAQPAAQGAHPALALPASQEARNLIAQPAAQGVLPARFISV